MQNNSLLQAFEPPEDGYVGQVCICCALSADQTFVEEAVKRFNRRLFDGAVNMYLMLDRTNCMLDSRSIKGLVQLQAKHDSKIKIQHAKVALMQFGKNRFVSQLRYVPGETIWRLVVCTGNWTTTSAEKNIEMVCQFDLRSDDTNPDKQIIADIWAGVEFLQNLQKKYFCYEDLRKRAKQMFECLKEFCNKSSENARFISSISGNSLFAQITGRFKNGNRGGLNFIQIGSGFYEQDKQSGIPFVVKSLDGFIEESRLFSKKITRRIVVNKKSAGQLVQWNWKDQGDDPWTLYDIKDPVENSNRDFLHAKYICVASKQSDGKGVKNARIYIGSGNLSKMGLFSAYGNVQGGNGAGNIEAGIVIDVDNDIARGLLACGSKIKDNSELVDTIEESFNKEAIPVFPIIAFVQEGNKLNPKCDEKILKSVKGSFGIETENGIVLMPFSSLKPITFPVSNPTAIHIIWSDHDYWIPVVCENGNLPASKIVVTSIDDLSQMLEEFPNIEESGEDGGGYVADGGSSPSVNYSDKSNKDFFPIQSAMNFVEKIARHNEMITDNSLLDWIDYLKRIMAALPQSEIDKMKLMRVNFLTVLKEDGFAPSHITQKRLWNQCVDEIANLWKGKRSISLTEEER